MCHPGRVADTNPSQRCGVGLFQFPVLLPASRKLIPKALLADSLGGFPNRGGADSSWRGGSRHGFSGEIARGLFGCRASGVGAAVEERQPEPAASVAGCGPGWHGPRLGGEDRRNGPPDAARLGPSLQRSGLEGLVDNWTEGPKPRLSADQLAELAQMIEAGPDREKDGVVRWRRLDLKRVIAERFGVDFHPRYVGKLLKKLGFSHISARPRHPADRRGFQKRMARPVCKGFCRD